VAVRYGEHGVFATVELAPYPGQIVTVVGPNGAGKSTLARVVVGSIKPQEGSIKRQRKLRIGYMPQRIKLDDSLPLTVDRFLWLGKPCSKTERLAILALLGVAHLRSEEHTSELQSRFDLVCRLLLEKKNRQSRRRSPTTSPHRAAPTTVRTGRRPGSERRPPPPRRGCSGRHITEPPRRSYATSHRSR